MNKKTTRTNPSHITQRDAASENDDDAMEDELGGGSSSSEESEVVFDVGTDIEDDVNTDVDPSDGSVCYNGDLDVGSLSLLSLKCRKGPSTM